MNAICLHRAFYFFHRSLLWPAGRRQRTATGRLFAEWAPSERRCRDPLSYIPIYPSVPMWCPRVGKHVQQCLIPYPLPSSSCRFYPSSTRSAPHPLLFSIAQSNLIRSISWAARHRPSPLLDRSMTGDLDQVKVFLTSQLLNHVNTNCKLCIKFYSFLSASFLLFTTTPPPT